MKTTVYAVLLGSGVWGVVAVLLVFALRSFESWRHRRRVALMKLDPQPDLDPWVQCTAAVTLRPDPLPIRLRCYQQKDHEGPHETDKIEWGAA